MANVFLTNGNAAITGQNIPNLNTSSIDLEIDNFTLGGRSQYIATHGPSVLSDMEFALWLVSDQLRLYLGGTSNTIGTFNTVFNVTGADLPTNTSFKITITDTNLCTVVVGGVTTVDSLAVTRGTASVVNSVFRLGAKSNASTGEDVSVSSFLPAGSKIGDSRLTVGGVQLINYTMPSDPAATVVPNSVSGQADGTVRGTTGSNFEVVSGITTRRVTFDIPAEIQALGAIRYFINRLDTGAQIETGTQDFNTATLEFNLDSIDTITNNLALSITATDANGTNDNTAGVMFGTALAVVTTS